MGLATASLVIRAFVVKHPAGAAEEVVSYDRHQNDGPFWVIAGYCGNEQQAMKLRDKEARVVNGVSWDDVRIISLKVRAK